MWIEFRGCEEGTGEGMRAPSASGSMLWRLIFILGPEGNLQRLLSRRMPSVALLLNRSPDLAVVVQLNEAGHTAAGSSVGGHCDNPQDGKGTAAPLLHREVTPCSQGIRDWF